MKKSSRQIVATGFTIVELLIVISVIVILASVVVASYIGVKNNANQAKTLSAFGQYEQMLRTYKSSNGYYPPTQTLDNSGAVATNIGSSTNGYVCLGTNFPVESPLAANQCMNSTSMPGINTMTNSTINNALETIDSNLPDSTGKTVSGNNSTYGTLTVRGVIYTSQRRRDGTSQNTQLIFAPPDGNTCGSATPVPPPTFPNTLCLLALQ